MRAFMLGIGLGAALWLFAEPANAQWKYADDKGVTKVTQYKLNMPERYRDSAVWVGPIGVGRPSKVRPTNSPEARAAAVT